MADIHIPDEALEAGVIAGLREAFSFVGATEDEIVALVNARRADRVNFELSRRQARAAFEAAVKNWPGMWLDTDYLTSNTQIILPLEASNG